MVQVIADFGLLSVRPYVDEAHQSVPLGKPVDKPNLSALQNEQEVVLVDPLGPLYANGKIIVKQQNGDVYVYGVVIGEIVEGEAA